MVVKFPYLCRNVKENVAKLSGTNDAKGGQRGGLKHVPTNVVSLLAKEDGFVVWDNIYNIMCKT